MSLNPGCRLSLLWPLGVVCLVIACTGSSPVPVPDEPAAPDSGDTAVETTLARRKQTVDAVGTADPMSSVGDGTDTQSPRLLLSASVGPPFGRADFYSGPGVVRDGVWITLGPNDHPGPLWDEGLSVRESMMGQVFDVCVLEEAWLIVYGYRYRTSSGAPAQFVGPWRRDFPECTTVDDPDHELFPRWAYVGETASSPYSRTKEEAFAWGREYEERRRSEAGPLPWNAHLLGTAGGSVHAAIEFDDAIAADQPVSVLGESLYYDAGTLRGLVRNWSPSQFAYGVQVSLGDAVWQWPLSIQPGERAPFQLDGLTLSEIPDVENLSVEARMRDEADLSRAFDFGCSPPWFHGNASDFTHRVPDAVYETLPPGGTHPMVLYCADANRHISSLPDAEHDNEPVVIDNLHSYVALMLRGHVIEIRKLITFTEYYTTEGGKIPRQVITGIPSERVIDGKSHRSSRALVAFAASHGADNEHTGWIIWIGGAHNIKRTGT